MATEKTKKNDESNWFQSFQMFKTFQSFKNRKLMTGDFRVQTNRDELSRFIADHRHT